jgi:dephospho-CoA kinase
MKKQKRDKKLVVGITGSFASGKSLVARLFRTPDAQVIDADKIAYDIVKPGKTAYAKIIKIFGGKVIGKGRAINRKALARIVFSSPKLLAKLNRVVHPEVVRIIKHKVAASGKKMVILDVPLLIESGLDSLVDSIIVVKAGRNAQIQRAKRKFKIKESDILLRIRAQIPLRKKMRVADFIIDNNGTVDNTRKQVGEIMNSLITPFRRNHG